MNNYKNWLVMMKKHLSYYKKNYLKIENNGVWNRNNKQYEHILPTHDAEKNYLCEYSKTALNIDERHKDWHHLNSSQTLCVNFFAPLIKIEDGRYLNEFMSHVIKKNIKIKKAVFEYVPIKKSTNFDFYLEDEETNKYYFEIKYTENGITTSGGGRNPHVAFKTYYEKDVKINESFKYVDENLFMDKHFQAYRNMVKGTGNNYSIFITMENNPSTYKELKSSLADLNVKKPQNIVLLYWERLVDETIDLFSSNTELVNYYKEFKIKYIP